MLKVTAVTLFNSHSGMIALALFLGAMVSCGGASHEIVGKWRTSGDANAILWEFSKDGSLLIGNSRGRYSLGDQSRVKIETPFATSLYQMEFASDRMTLKDPTGSKLEFTRIR